MEAKNNLSLHLILLHTYEETRILELHIFSLQVSGNIEIVMNELRKNQKNYFDLQIHPTLLNSTYLHCEMTGFIPIRVQKFQNVE